MRMRPETRKTLGCGALIAAMLLCCIDVPVLWAHWYQWALAELALLLAALWLSMERADEETERETPAPMRGRPKFKRRRRGR